jgi:pimeloyl-ACP methyl ester carboxylesterase
MDVRKIKTAPGLEFDCSLAGSPDRVPVLLLHGFGVSRHFWDRQVPALADAGYFAIAPNQRGYSPGARPDPKDLDAYHIDRLVGDALDIVAAAGHGGSRFHPVGHDWGGSLSWIIAARHPERLRYWAPWAIPIASPPSSTSIQNTFGAGVGLPHQTPRQRRTAFRGCPLAHVSWPLWRLSWCRLGRVDVRATTGGKTRQRSSRRSGLGQPGNGPRACGRESGRDYRSLFSGRRRESCSRRCIARYRRSRSHP